MKKEMKKDSREAHDQVMNGDSDLSSLLASKDRDYLLSPNGNQVKVSSLDGKIIGIYFSANWYPPCRNFNQALVDFYLQLKKNINNSNFEIVYVSSDEDTSAFNTYRETMPWLAIPFSDIDTKKALNRRFDVEGIPCLVILQPNDKKGEETLYDGVELVHRYGVQAFPFTRERLEQLRGEERERHENQSLVNLLTNSHRDFLLCHPRPKQVGIDTLAGKTVGLYFSAQWCTPCADFTPKLTSIYRKINQALITTTTNPQSQSFEIVFVSCDTSQSCFDTYFASMPWSALPFGDESVKNLVKHFDVKVIPSLVILGPDGKTVTLNGRNLINLYRESCYPFTEDRIVILEKELEEEAKSLPSSVFHSGHRHELSMVSDGNGGGPFICCDCDEQGSGWAYICLECGYEIHPKCARSQLSSLGSLSSSGPGEWECRDREEVVELETSTTTSQGLNKVTALFDFGGDKGK